MALLTLAAVLAQKVGLFGRLHTFRHHLRSQCA